MATKYGFLRTGSLRREVGFSSFGARGLGMQMASGVPGSSRTTEHSSIEPHGAPYRDITVLQRVTALHRTPPTHWASSNGSTVAIFQPGSRFRLRHDPDPLSELLAARS